MNLLKAISGAIGIILAIMFFIAAWYVIVMIAVIAVACFVGYMIYQYSTKTEDEIWGVDED